MVYRRDPRPPLELGPVLDLEIVRMAHQARPWGAIGRTVGLTGKAVREYAEGLDGMPGWTRGTGETPDDALPAGHPVSWGLLTAGTSLEGARYAA